MVKDYRVGRRLHDVNQHEDEKVVLPDAGFEVTAYKPYYMYMYHSRSILVGALFTCSRSLYHLLGWAHMEILYQYW